MTDAPDPEYARLRDAAIRLLRENRPEHPPLLFFLMPMVEYFETRHIERMRAGPFPEARRAFNPVFIHLPADGCRLTELARKADMSKQAMAELVEELEALGYLVRFPDPRDGRAKIIMRSDKGLAAHGPTLQAFAAIEAELGAMIGEEALAALRARLSAAAAAIEADG